MTEEVRSRHAVPSQRAVAFCVVPLFWTPIFDSFDPVGRGWVSNLVGVGGRVRVWSWTIVSDCGRFALRDRRDGGTCRGGEVRLDVKRKGVRPGMADTRAGLLIF